jgi:hypothetical protein
MIGLLFVLLGPGRFSLDALLFGKNSGTSSGFSRLSRQSQE